MEKCNLCGCEFDPEEEGGIVGFIGMMPNALCPVCWNGMKDAVEIHSISHCPHCHEPLHEDDD